MAKKTDQDPTGLGSERKKGLRLISDRLSSAERQIKKSFRSIPRKRRRKAVIANAEETVYYDYEYTAEQQQDMTLLISATLSLSLLQTLSNTADPTWYFVPAIEKPFRMGAITEVSEFNQLISQAKAKGFIEPTSISTPIDPSRIVLGTEYFDGLKKDISEAFTQIKGLSDEAQKQVSGVINRGIRAGTPPTQIIDDITKRFDVARSSAKRTVDTAVNAVYNNSIMRTNKEMSRITGLRAAVIHISALLPTTRSWHGSRHGNAYTPQAQERWWDEGTNRINCYCTIRSILVDKKGNVYDQDTLDSIIEQGEQFFQGDPSQ